jgi:hypothetical protein
MHLCDEPDGVFSQFIERNILWDTDLQEKLGCNTEQEPASMNTYYVGAINIVKYYGLDY